MEVGAHILVVDDDDDLRALLQIILRANGYSVSESPSLKHAMELLCSQKFALVLLDVNLPDGCGYRVAEFIHTNKLSSKVVVITGSSGIENAVKGAAYGVRDYLPKPFDEQHLLRSIEHVLSIEAPRAKTLNILERYGILLSGIVIFVYYLWVAIDFFTNPNARRDFNGSFFQFSSVFMLWGMLFLGAKLYEYVKKQKEEHASRLAVIHEYENRLVKLELLNEVSEQVNDAVNNPLAVISISASSIRKQFEPDSEILAYLDSIEGALRRVKEVLASFQSNQTTKIVRSIQDVAARQSSSDKEKVLLVDPTGDIRPS